MGVMILEALYGVVWIYNAYTGDIFFLITTYT